MRYWRRAVCAALALVLTALLIPASLADGRGGAIGSLHLDAEQQNVSRKTLELELFQEAPVRGFRFNRELQITAQVNQVSRDVNLRLTAFAEGTRLEIEYLTDLDQDDKYEMLLPIDIPIYDTVDADGQLVNGEEGEPLEAGREYIINGRSLMRRAEQAIRDRMDKNSRTFLSERKGIRVQVDNAVYLITLTQPSGDSVTYYLQMYLQMPEPDAEPEPEPKPDPQPEPEPKPEPDPVLTAADFRDVPERMWYFQAIDYVVRRGLMKGGGDGTFSPDSLLTREQLAYTLYRLAGMPGDTGNASYPDVSKDSAFYPAIAWAAKNGLMSGLDTGLFEPRAALTREQLAICLQKFAQFKGVKLTAPADLSGYADSDTVSFWAEDYMGWAVAEKLLGGYDDGTLRPTAQTTRAEVAVVLQKYCEGVLP